MAPKILELLTSRPPVVSVVRMEGVIGVSRGYRGGITLAQFADPLAAAFTNKRAQAVALVINSPGGAAAQSMLLFRRIRALAQENMKKVIVFVEDVAASGGYLLALAGDEIIADDASIIGSIGVISGGFGFDRLIEKFGVERRIYAAGDNKAMLDPFSPENPAHVARMKELLSEVHQQFITVVNDRRRSRLAGDPAELFSGAFWTGSKAKSLGLIDGTGEIRSTLRARFGDRLRFRLYAPQRSWFRAPVPGVAQAANLAEDVVLQLETRGLWSRYGL